MIAGGVQNLHALVPVTFRLDDQPDLSLEFVIDTGFAGFLTLPPAAIAALSLPYQYDMPANLADDSEVQLPVYDAAIVWNGVERAVPVLATGRRPLLGTELLRGNELVIQFAEGGMVTVDDL